MARRNRKNSSSTATSSAVSSRIPSRATSPTPQPPFRFFDLPAELRLRIYEHILLTPKPLDLDPYNPRHLHPRLAIFLASRRAHEEAYPVFYSQPIRLFPAPETQHFYTKRPLLSRLPPHYRAAITTVNLRFGPGWSSPPRCQNTLTNPGLGLRDCTSLRTLRIFIDFDPSDSILNGFRGKGATEDTYKFFCLDLLRGVLEQVPRLETVELDAFPVVKRDAPLVVALRKKVEEAGRRVVWGPLRGWERDEEEEEGLVTAAMAGMAISDVPARMVEVQA